MTAQEAIAQMAEGVYLRSPMTGSVMALVSPYHGDGVVAPVYRDAQAGGQRAAFHYGKEGRTFVAVGVADPVTAARKLADFGFCGLMLDEQVPVYFFNRASDPDVGLPTVVGTHEPGRVDAEGWTFLDATGSADIALGDLVAWRDFARIDPLTRQWMGTGPFPSYEPDTPLYEVRAGQGVVVASDGAELLGAAIADQGAVTLFSDREAAEDQLQRLKDGVRFRLAAHDGLARRVAFREPSDAADLEIVEVPNLAARLDQHLAEQGPFLDIGLNSPGHRFSQGYFFRGGNAWFLRTITGAWRVIPPFTLEAAKATPPKADTVDGGR